MTLSNNFSFFVINYFVPLTISFIGLIYFIYKRFNFFSSFCCEVLSFILSFCISYNILSYLRTKYKIFFKLLSYSNLDEKICLENSVFIKFYNMYDEILKYVVMAVLIIILKVFLSKFLIKDKGDLFLKLISFSIGSSCFFSIFNGYIFKLQVRAQNLQMFSQYFIPNKLKFLLLLFNSISIFGFEFCVSFFVFYIVKNYMLKKRFKKFFLSSFLLILYNSLIFYILKVPVKLKTTFKSDGSFFYDFEYLKQINHMDVKLEILLVFIFIFTFLFVVYFIRKLKDGLKRGEGTVDVKQ